MPLTRLKIRNFRNLAAIDLELAPGINLFFGPNAQGKSALLETVGYLATSTSHRTRRDEEIIRWEEAAAYAKGVLDDDEDNTLEFGLSREGKQVKVGGGVLKRICDLYGRLRVVLFVPEDLEIVSGSPTTRRRFIDLTIAQVDPRHITQLQKVQHILRARNQLLKRAQSKRGIPDEMEIWDEQLVQAATPVIRTRQTATREIAEGLKRFHNRITEERETLSLSYHSTVVPVEGQSLETAFNERLIGARDRDIQNGSTSIGPHRDDLEFALEGRDLRAFGSQGQRRTGVLALRLAEIEWLKQKTGQDPVLLLDDVIYEMDEKRRQHFFEQIDRGGQVLITATEIEHLAPLAPRAKLFEVKAGALKEVQRPKSEERNDE